MAQLDSIPQSEATTLFQTVLTDNDKCTLQKIVRAQVGELKNTLNQDDYLAASCCWNLLKRLRTIEHSEIAEILEEQVIPHMRTYAVDCISTFNKYASQRNFTEAERLLELLRSLNEHFPDEDLVDLKRLEKGLIEARARFKADRRWRNGVIFLAGALGGTYMNHKYSTSKMSLENLKDEHQVLMSSFKALQDEARVPQLKQDDDSRWAKFVTDVSLGAAGGIYGGPVGGMLGGTLGGLFALF